MKKNVTHFVPSVVEDQKNVTHFVPSIVED